MRSSHDGDILHVRVEGNIIEDIFPKEVTRFAVDTVSEHEKHGAMELYGYILSSASDVVGRSDAFSMTSSALGQSNPGSVQMRQCDSHQRILKNKSPSSGNRINTNAIAHRRERKPLV